MNNSSKEDVKTALEIIKLFKTLNSKQVKKDVIQALTNLNLETSTILNAILGFIRKI